MRISPHGITLLENREGIRLKVYRDSKGIPTVGVGHVCLPADNLKVGDHITQAQCDAFLAQDVVKCENAVNGVNVPLTQWQFDALVSFIFNIGVGGFNGSSVKRHLKAKEYAKAAQSMMMWVKPPEITGRRQTEVNQFLHPDHFYSQNSAASTANSGNTSKSATTQPAITPAEPPILQKGATGQEVRDLQNALDIKIDGVFGANTESAVRAFQSTHHLAADGKVGINTRKALHL